MIPIVCMACGETGEVAKVAAKMLHTCGSQDVELWEGTPEQLSRIASRREPEPTFAEFMTRQSAQRGMPKPVETDPEDPGLVGDEVAGWDEYTGPPPSPNPFNAPQHSGPGVQEPTKKVPGIVQPSNAYVYDKHDPPQGYGENPPAPLVAEHDYPSHVTHTPFLGQRKEGVEGIALPGTSCPVCFAPKTAIVADHREHAHWFCHERCGSLVDLDKHPYVDPYRPDIAFGLSRGWGRDGYHKEKRAFAGRKDGTLLRRIATVARTNPGLNLSETVFLARQSVIQHPEA